MDVVVDDVLVAAVEVVDEEDAEVDDCTGPPKVTISRGPWPANVSFVGLSQSMTSVLSFTEQHAQLAADWS